MKKYDDYLAHHGVKGMKWGEINWLDKIKTSPQLKALAASWSSAYKNYQNTKVAKINGNAKQDDVEAAKEKAKNAAVSYKNGLQELASKYQSENPDKFNPQLSPEEQAAKDQDEAERAEKKAAKKAEKEAIKKKQEEDMIALAKEKEEKEAEKAKKKQESEERKKAAEEKRKQKEAQQAEKASQPQTQTQTTTTRSSSSSPARQSGGGSQRQTQSQGQAQNGGGGQKQSNKQDTDHTGESRRNGEFETIRENPGQTNGATSKSGNVTSPKGKTATSSTRKHDEEPMELSKGEPEKLSDGLKRGTKEAESSLGWDSISDGAIGSMKVGKSVLDNIASSSNGKSAIETISVAVGKIRESKASSITRNKKLRQQFARYLSRKDVSSKAKSYNEFIKAVKNS